MRKKIYQPHDKDFKFKYKRMGLKIHNYVHKTKHKKIEFLDTEDAESGKRSDLVYNLDDGKTYHEENESTPISDDDVFRFHNYNKNIVCDKSNTVESVESFCICTAKPQDEVFYLKVNANYIFKLLVFYTKNIDGAKALSRLKDKVKKQVELSDDDQVELLFLPDSDIDMPIKSLMEEIAFIIRNANIPLETYKDLVACFIQTFKRFFEGDELSEMISLLNKQREKEKIASIIETYGMGFDDVYLDGKYDGKIEGKKEGKLETASTLLDRGMDVNTVSEIVGISINEINEFKSGL